MTVTTHSEAILPRAVQLFRFKHLCSDDLFVVSIWSVVDMALSGLFIWLDLGQINPLSGLG
jgi:hypothetical protein